MSEVLSSSTHLPAPVGIMSQSSTYKDMRSEVMHGKCSACGHIDPKEYIQCEGGDLLCPACRIEFNGKSYCEGHFTELVGNKHDFYVLWGIAKRFAKPKILSAAAISEEEATAAFKRLKEKKYIKVKDYGKQEIKITDAGRLALEALARTFQKYSDAATFMSKVEEHA